MSSFDVRYADFLDNFTVDDCSPGCPKLKQFILEEIEQSKQIDSWTNCGEKLTVDQAIVAFLNSRLGTHKLNFEQCLEAIKPNKEAQIEEVKEFRRWNINGLNT